MGCFSGGVLSGLTTGLAPGPGAGWGCKVRRGLGQCRAVPLFSLVRRCYTFQVRRLTFTPSQNLYSCTTIVLITAVLF
jgi:hypothetical protein